MDSGKERPASSAPTEPQSQGPKETATPAPPLERPNEPSAASATELSPRELLRRAIARLDEVPLVRLKIETEHESAVRTTEVVARLSTGALFVRAADWEYGFDGGSYWITWPMSNDTVKRTPLGGEPVFREFVRRAARQALGATREVLGLVEELKDAGEDVVAGRPARVLQFRLGAAEGVVKVDSEATLIRSYELRGDVRGGAGAAFVTGTFENPEPWKDPVVEEIRDVRRQIDAEVGGDVHAYFERLRKAQDAARVVQKIERAPGGTAA